MFIEDIKTASPFRDLFPINEAVLDKIVWNMRKYGYDSSQPITIWNNSQPVVIDGHTRLRAARKAGIFSVPVVCRSFAGKDEALQYAIGCQRNRRNLRDADIARYISELELLTKPKSPDEKIHTLGQTTQETAALLGISQSKAGKTKSVLRRAPEDVIALVKAGEISINRAYERTHKPAHSPPEDKLDNIFKVVTSRLDKGEISELISRLQNYLNPSCE